MVQHNCENEITMHDFSITVRFVILMLITYISGTTRERKCHFDEIFVIASPGNSHFGIFV